MLSPLKAVTRTEEKKDEKDRNKQRNTTQRQ